LGERGFSLAAALLRKWFVLHRAERRCLALACLALPAVRLGLSVASVQTVSRLIARASPRPRHNRSLRPERIVWAVEAAGARLPRSSTCLTRALVAHLLLRREGVASRVRLGVSHDAQQRPRAHAWVEWGESLGDSPDQGFSPFALDLGAL
jgi:hypothetical protein